MLLDRLSNIGSIYIIFCLAKLATAEEVVQTSSGYQISGVGTFNYLLQVDFTKVTAVPDEFYLGNFTVGAGSAPYSRTSYPENVKINQGDSLSLLVPGKPIVNNDIPSAEIGTVYKDILYGSVRTVARVSNVSGTCHGLFFYRNDTQESDIEILTKNSSKVWFTNQATSSDGDATSTNVASPADIVTVYHEYRLDWLADRTDYYIDGVKKATLKQNVPSKPGSWIWNNWANGGSWTGPPPTNASDFRIKSITGYFNRTSIKFTPSSVSSSSGSTISKTRSSSRLNTSTLKGPSSLSTMTKSTTSNVRSSSSTIKSSTSTRRASSSAKRTSSCTKNIITIHKKRASTAKTTARRTSKTPSPTKAQNKAKSTSKR